MLASNLDGRLDALQEVSARCVCFCLRGRGGSCWLGRDIIERSLGGYVLNELCLLGGCGLMFEIVLGGDRLLFCSSVVGFRFRTFDLRCIQSIS